MAKSKIGIMGGTFDPVHNGHLTAASSVRNLCGLDVVYLMPAFIPPHKSGVTKPKHRLKMLELAVEGVEGVQIETREMKRKGTTFTVDTLEELRKELPDTEFFYIIGADVILDLCTWKNFKKVFTLCHFIGIMRPGFNRGAVEERIDWLEKEFNAKIILVDIPQSDISSTGIRELAKDGQLLGLVPEKVALYIAENEIYGR